MSNNFLPTDLYKTVEGQKVKIAPITHPDCVIDENGKSVSELISDIRNFTATYNVTIPTDWSDETPYTQTVEVEGVKETDAPIVDIILSDSIETAEAEEVAWSNVSRIITGEGFITVLCYKEKPEVTMNIQLKVVR